MEELGGDGLMVQGNRKTEIPFARAYDFLTADPKLSAAEKLVMIQICRYWPEPCYMSAATIAKNCGLDPRYVRRIIKGLSQGAKKRKQLGKLPRRRYVKRGYVHTRKNGKEWTCRVINPVCFPIEKGAPIGPPQRAYRPRLQEPESSQSAPIGPPNRTGIEEGKKRNRSGGSPSPAEGQAHSPLLQKRVRSDLTPDEFARRRQEQLDRLKADEAMRTGVANVV
jgi:hypothetical protein